MASLFNALYTRKILIFLGSFLSENTKTARSCFFGIYVSNMVDIHPYPSKHNAPHIHVMKLSMC